eukprot:g3939.t1
MELDAAQRTVNEAVVKATFLEENVPLAKSNLKEKEMELESAQKAVNEAIKKVTFLKKKILLARFNLKEKEMELESAQRVVNEAITKVKVAKDAVNEAKTSITNKVDFNREDVAVMLLIFFVTFAFYCRTVYPSLPGGDSGELLVAACNLGVPHPPGYPLWTIIAAIVIRIPNILNEEEVNTAWRINVMVAFFGSLAAVFIYMSSILFTRFRAAAFASAMLYAFSENVWSNSIQAEVFSLNNFLCSVLLFIAIRFVKATEQKQNKMNENTPVDITCAIFGAFVGGLCLSNQHTSLFFVAPIAIFATVRIFFMYSLQYVLLLGISGLAGLLPYLYLPLSNIIEGIRIAQEDGDNTVRFPLLPAASLDSWGNVSNFSGFMKHVLRQEYGRFCTHTYFSVAVAIALISFQCQRSWIVVGKLGSVSFREYGKQILKSIPKNSLLLVSGDLNHNSVKYVQQCERFRTDIDILSPELMSYEWFTSTHARHYKRISFPASVYHPKNGYHMADFLVQNLDSYPYIFLAGDWKDGDGSASQYFDLVPFGLSSRVQPNKNVIAEAKKQGAMIHIEKSWPDHDASFPLKLFKALPSFALPSKHRKGSWEGALILNVQSAYILSMRLLLLDSETTEEAKSLKRVYKGYKQGIQLFENAGIEWKNEKFLRNAGATAGKMSALLKKRKKRNWLKAEKEMIKWFQKSVTIGEERNQNGTDDDESIQRRNLVKEILQSKKNVYTGSKFH